jgi:hypothetical protein
MPKAAGAASITPRWRSPRADGRERCASSDASTTQIASTPSEDNMSRALEALRAQLDRFWTKALANYKAAAEQRTEEVS